MFVEQEFEEKRPEEIQRIIADFPLASIVANTSEGLIAEHVPLMLQEDSHLFGHVSLNNALFKSALQNHAVLCIFKADDAYISANYYPSKFQDHKKVPTWNYQVVHVYGEIAFFSDDKTKLAMLGKLTKYQEQKTNGQQAWKMSDAPKDYLLGMLKDLVAFKIKITKVVAKSKLSQNREPADFENVVKELQAKGHDRLASSMSMLER